jgi:prepilin-type N-terminal cleavage/methylation domain-containing protein
VRRDERGFTLLELMIVVTIVGVLATVAIPMFQMVPERSKATEAMTALGLIRSAMRIYYAEHGTFANATHFRDGSLVTSGGMLDIRGTDLDGRYFSAECYTFSGAPTANSFTVNCDGSASTALCGSEVFTIMVSMDQNGDIARTF